MADEKRIRKIVREVLDRELKSLLRDVTYRLGVLDERAKQLMGESHRITSGMLNLPMHQLDGFVITDNSPTAGKIAWADCNIVYKGTVYEIDNGNTDKKFVWWEADSTPTKFKVGDAKPSLTDDDVLVCINDGGAHQMVIGVGRMTPGSSILTGTVDSAEIAAGAVLTGKIASSAITEGLLATGAVTVNKIGAGAVSDVKLATDSVTSEKIKESAVTDAKINTGAVSETKLAANAVTSGKIKDDAVTSGKIYAGAVTSAKLADNAVISDKINSGAVTSGKLADNSVTSGKIASGSVAESKLDVALHMLF